MARQSLSSQDLVAMASHNMPVVEEAGAYWGEHYNNGPMEPVVEEYPASYEEPAYPQQDYYESYGDGSYGDGSYGDGSYNGGSYGGGSYGGGGRHLEEERWGHLEEEKKWNRSNDVVVKEMQETVLQQLIRELEVVLANDLLKKLVIIGYRTMETWNVANGKEQVICV